MGEYHAGGGVGACDNELEHTSGEGWPCSLSIMKIGRTCLLWYLEPQRSQEDKFGSKKLRVWGQRLWQSDLANGE